MSVFGNGMNGAKHRRETARTGVWSSVRARVVSVASTITVLIMALIVGACSQDYRSCVVDGVTVYGPFGNNCPGDVLTTVELTLETGVGSATATARVTAGVVPDSGVIITAVISNADSNVPDESKVLPALSGGAGQEVSAQFFNLQPGQWSLNKSAINAPQGIILNVVTTPDTVTPPDAPPVMTVITPSADGDDLAVRVNVARGEILTSSASVELTLTGGGSPDVRKPSILLPEPIQAVRRRLMTFRPATTD